MVSKLFIVAICAVFAQGLPTGKDLAADISDAKLKVSFFDIEVVEMINRLNILQVELGLPVEDLAQSILQNLNAIALEEDVNEVRRIFRAFRNDFQADSEEYRPILAQQMRTTLNRVHDELDTDLNQVPITTNILKAEIANADVTYTRMMDNMERHTVDADTAITTSINGQSGSEVVLIYSDWQKIIDILDNEQFLTTNVKVVFDARGNDATTALDVVIGQIP